VNITQLFRNDEKQPIEAVYCFPIEENAAIYSFTAKIDDREICAQLKEKAQAQQEYTQALQQGHAAYLMEQDEKSQDIFIINVGGLLPGKECQIEIKYVTELALIDGNKTRFVIPTTIAPRYNPSVGGISSPAGTQTKYVQSAPYTVDFLCQIDRLNEQVTGVSSSSHPITIQFKENLYEITFGQKNTFMDRDIIVDINLSNRTNTILAVEKNSKNQLALMASFIPTNEDCQKVLSANKQINDVNNEFIFIVDCSGSMRDENKIGLAREAMILFLKSLPVNCQFNIIRFGSDYRTLFTQVTDKYNEQNAKQAEQLILQMSADLGGTELLGPLQWLQNQPPAANNSRQILLLTDGEISNVTQVMDLCRSISTSSRIFSFGLGHAPSRSLIKGLARSTNGRFTFIPPGTSVDIYVAEQLQKALEPCITNVKVKWNIASSSKLQSVPTVVPPVYANDRLLLYALIESEQFNHSTTVELWNQEETVRLGLASIDHVPEIIDYNNQLITHLAAKALIQEITHEKDIYAGSQQTRFQKGKEDDNKKRLIDISLKYNILCPHTAFIGIETRTDSSTQNANANMVLREIPIEISADDKAMAGLFVGSSSNSFSSLLCLSAAPPPPPPPPSMLGGIANYSRRYNSSFLSAAPPPPTLSSNFSFGSRPNCQPSSSSASSNQQFCPLPPPPLPASLSFASNSSTSSCDCLLNEMRCFNTPKMMKAKPTSTFSINEQKTWPSNDQDIVRHLINLQKFDGLWNLSESDIQNLCQKPLTSFHSNLTPDSSILITVIVVIILEMKFNSFKTMWSFIVNKARKRLTELLGDNEKLEQLMNEFKKQL
jgi:hypothetical protein